MIFVKKFLTNLILLVGIVIIFLALLVIAASRGYLNKPVKNIIEYYLHQKGDKIQIGNLQIKNNILSIDKIFMDLANNNKGEIADFKINVTIDDITSKALIHSAMDIGKFALITQDKQILINSKISGNYTINFLKNKIQTQLILSPINNSALLDSYGNKLPDGEGICSYKSKISIFAKKSISCKLTFGDKSYLLFNAKLDGSKVQASGNIENIPLMIYQFAKKSIPDNKITSFLQEFIAGGYIRTGNFDLNLDYANLDLNSLADKLKANLRVVDLEYKYDKDCPALSKIDTNVTISGASVEFLINQAYSSNSVLSGVMTFDWQGKDKSNFVFNADAKGKVIDLIEFISNDNYDKVKKQGIDLKKITGQATSKIELIIPINPNIKNSYNISTVMTGVNIKAFSDNIILQNAKITGTFNGDKIHLIGTGKINNYDSDVSYQHYINDNNQSDYNYLLNVKTKIIANKQKISLLKLISGSNILDFEYKEQKDGKNSLKASSNLTNLEFYIDKISIHKKPYSKAKFNLTGHLDSNLTGNIEFNLSGDNNLKIISNINLLENKYQIIIPTINYKDTNLIGKIILGKDYVQTEIHGKELDLSESNMMQFLEKEGDPRNIDLKVDVEQVRLKNNIMLGNLKLQILCNKTKCFSGSLDSKIGTKSFKMLLVDKKDLEEWLITCDNAGALFRGIGMYNNMKSGIINLTLDTKRHDVKTGEIIPILEGTFDIKNFVVTDISFLTRMVSFVSFPGFISFIVNNKDVMFNNMTGKFNYIGNNIKITETSATGPFFDFTMKGIIDTNKHQIHLKGNVIPSFFFVSNVITKIPIIGKIFSKVAPYSVDLDYKE